jgi:hypothetical protein
MKIILIKIKSIFLLIAAIILIPAGCSGQPVSSPLPTSIPKTSLSQYQLEYLLIFNYKDVFWCDPDFYPVAREGQEQQNAMEQFPAIKAATGEFSAIIDHLNLPDKADYNDIDKLNIYREHKTLTHAVQMTPSGNIYNFTLRVGEGQGQRIEGTITKSGEIKVLKTETSFNTCPICLAKGTLIDTPSGQIAVELIQPGMVVWTEDYSGNRIAATVLKSSSTPVPDSFQVVRITLSDGRTVTASPGHSTADLRGLGQYSVGDIIDGATVISIERISYASGATYDLLPSGDTGFYWANGILLGSTLMR